jgi:hypothetical protein
MKKPSSLRTILATVSLCLMLAPGIARSGASKVWFKKPAVELQASTKVITYPCSTDEHSASRSCPTTADLQVDLTAVINGFNRQSAYVYTVTGGRIVGQGSKVSWDLSEAGPGFYAVTVEVQDNKKHRASSTVNVTVQNCRDCIISDFPCPMMVVTCYDQVRAGTPITCKVVVGSSTRPPPTGYEWSARDSSGDASERISGQGTYISIRTDGLGGQTVFVTVKVKGLDPSCPSTGSGSTIVKP